MNYKKISVTVIVALVVVIGGIFWSGQRPDPDQRPTQQERADKFKDFNEAQWSVSPEASLDLREETQEQEEKLAYNRFTIPGRVIFPSNARTQKVQLEVSILPLSRSRAAQISQQAPKNPVRFMFKGNAEKNFQQEQITRTISTDKSGNFAIKNAVPGLYGVRTSDPQWTGSIERQQVEIASRVRPLQFKIHQTSKFVGTVVNPDGQPIESAKIAFTTKSGQKTTNSEGQFQLTALDPNEKIDYVKILKEGYKPYYLDQKPLKPGEIRHDTFTLKKGSVLTVRVRSVEGEPIKNGKLILTRADDKKITSKHHLAAAHGGGKIVSLNDQGEYTFTSLRPGKIKVTMRFSDYIPEVKTVELNSGTSQSTTLTVRKGLPLNITYINEKNGNTIRNILPKIRVYNREGNRIEPGYVIQNMTPTGTIEAFLHPETHEFKIRSESRLGKFQTKTETFGREALPDVRVTMTPAARPQPSRPPAPPGLLKLQSNDDVNWSAISRGSIIVIDQQSGERVLGRSGKNNLFEEPFPLNPGNYVIYGLFNRSEKLSLSFLEPITIESKHPGKLSISLSSSASLEGNIAGLEDNYKGLEVGLGLVSQESLDTAKSLYFPDDLTTSVRKDGSFQLGNVPSGIATTLYVMVGEDSPLTATGGTILDRIKISPLQPGQNRTLSTIQISAPTE